MSKSNVRVWVGAAVLAAAPCVLAGPDWIEQGDAGANFSTAQRTLGVGQLRSISGSLSSGLGNPDLEDVFFFSVMQPTLLSIEINSASFDAQLWLFNITLGDELFGLLANNDRAVGNTAPRILQQSNDGTGAQVLNPGEYAIAVTGLGRIPVSANGAMYNFASATEISGADGVGGLLPFLQWSGTGQTGGYVVDMEGTGFFDLPAPGSAAVLAMAGALAARRRRMGR